MMEGGEIIEQRKTDGSGVKEEAALLIELQAAAEKELSDLISLFEREITAPTKQFSLFIKNSVERLKNNRDSGGGEIKDGFNDIFSRYNAVYSKRKEDGVFRHNLFDYFVHAVGVLDLLKMDIDEGKDSKKRRKQALELIRYDYEKAKSFLAQKINGSNGKEV
ncbi:MAG: hypothetical protein WC310_02865 [Patescibacteria group bacterium]|jgi:hypothetical protein